MFFEGAKVQKRNKENPLQSILKCSNIAAIFEGRVCKARSISRSNELSPRGGAEFNVSFGLSTMAFLFDGDAGVVGIYRIPLPHFWHYTVWKEIQLLCILLWFFLFPAFCKGVPV